MTETKDSEERIRDLVPITHGEDHECYRVVVSCVQIEEGACLLIQGRLVSSRHMNRAWT